MSGVMRTYIAGPRHHTGALQALNLMKRGEKLALVREPGNPHDANAVAVRDRAGLKLGYVPRADAPTVAKAMDTGYTVRAVFLCGNAVEITWEKPAGHQQEVTI